jgi:hypothetical protein
MLLPSNRDCGDIIEATGLGYRGIEGRPPLLRVNLCAIRVGGSSFSDEGPSFGLSNYDFN